MLVRHHGQLYWWSTRARRALYFRQGTDTDIEHVVHWAGKGINKQRVVGTILRNLDRGPVCRTLEPQECTVYTRKVVMLGEHLAYHYSFRLSWIDVQGISSWGGRWDKREVLAVRLGFALAEER
jgi:hypothetical protein